MQLLLWIYVLLGVAFQGLKMCWIKRISCECASIPNWKIVRADGFEIVGASPSNTIVIVEKNWYLDATGL